MNKIITPIGLIPVRLRVALSPTTTGDLLSQDGVFQSLGHEIILIMPESSSKTDSLDQPIDTPSPQPPLEVLWREFGSQLRRRARTRLRQYGLTGQAESMDICNDVMVDLARRQAKNQHVPTALDANDVLGYIMRAIDNQVLDTFRTLARHCRDFRRTDTMPIDEMPVAIQATTPSQVALRKEVIARIRALLGPDDARIVDLMLENRSWQEIGATIGIQPDTARMRVKRALDRVRTEIGVNDPSHCDDQKHDERLAQGDA